MRSAAADTPPVMATAQNASSWRSDIRAGPAARRSGRGAAAAPRRLIGSAGIGQLIGNIDMKVHYYPILQKCEQG
jgi:hypothetical protein